MALQSWYGESKVWALHSSCRPNSIPPKWSGVNMKDFTSGRVWCSITNCPISKENMHTYLWILLHLWWCPTSLGIELIFFDQMTKVIHILLSLEYISHCLGQHSISAGHPTPDGHYDHQIGDLYTICMCLVEMVLMNISIIIGILMWQLTLNT